MERNLELVKKILVKAEEHCAPDKALFVYDVEIEGHDKDAIRYHCDLLFEAGLLLPSPAESYRFTKASDDPRGYSTFVIHRLTWEEHEFLDNAREPKVWDAAVQTAGNLSWGTFTSVLTALACEYAKAKLSAYGLFGGS